MINKLFVLLLFLGSVMGVNRSNAQNWGWVWAKTAGGLGNGTAYSVAIDFMGCSYVVGTFTGTIVFDTLPITSFGSNDIFLVKFDALGTVLWVKSAGGTNNDIATSVAVDDFGSVYVTGYYSSPTLTFGTNTINNIGSYDIFLAKYDVMGDVVWVKDAGGAGNDISTAVAVNSSGSVYITGSYESKTVVFDTFVHHNTAYTYAGVDTSYLANTFITEYSASGNVVWTTCAGATGEISPENRATSLTIDKYDNIYISGTCSGSSNLTFGSTVVPATNTIYLVKYSSWGNALWSKCGGCKAGLSCGPTDTHPATVATDTAGNVYITGYFGDLSVNFGTGGFTNQGSVGYKDIYLVKFDKYGNWLWGKSVYSNGYDSHTYSNNFDDYSFGVTTDSKGNVYIAGYFTGALLIPTTVTDTINTVVNPYFSSRYTQLFMLKYDTYGNVKWKTTAIGGSSNEATFLMASSTDDIFVLGKYALDSITLGWLTLHKNTSNILITKFNEAKMFVTDLVTDNTEIIIQPNPTTNKLTLTCNTNTNITNIEIYDMLGRQVYYQNCFLNNSVFEISLPDLKDGLYYLRAVGNNINKNLPFLIKR